MEGSEPGGTKGLPDLASVEPGVTDLALSWRVVSNQLEGGRCLLELIAQNRGDRPLRPDGWSIYFSSVNVPEPGNDSDPVRIEHVNGDLCRLVPCAGFAGLGRGDELRVRYVANAWALQTTDAPRGAFLVYDENTGAPRAHDLGDPRVLPLCEPAQLTRGPGDEPLHDAERAFEKNAAHRFPAVGEHCPITPTPELFEWLPSTFALDASTSIVHAAELASEALFLRDSLAPLLGAPPGLSRHGAPGAIWLALEPTLASSEAGEGYRLEVTPEAVRLTGASPEAVFRGVQSLLQLLPPESFRGHVAALSLRCCRMGDRPRYPYRGLHLDVARNFSSLATLRRVIELMALYKLNRLHLHLTDDEGWRFEVRALPELTSYGARRGYSPDEQACLPPSFGSGVAQQPPGSGFYTQEELLELLRFAKARHILVIPEIDVPGHARAAVKSMEVRYRRLAALGELEEAERYLLSDLDDRSEYQSNQGWRDNVVCVALESTYTFVETVVSELKQLYARADAPLLAVHVGGDELPSGCWQRSPRCLALQEELGLPRVESLRDYFYGRLRDIFARLELRLAGWEEIALVPGVGTAEPNPQFAGAGFIPYVWNNCSPEDPSTGAPQADLVSRLSRAGYRAVLCSASDLYLDFAYEKHPEEPGYYWAGYIDVKRILELAPREDVLGIQAQLWGENLRSSADVEGLLLPRLLAVAERAWSRASTPFEVFAQRLGERELPRLDGFLGGFRYRIPAPGAKLEGGLLHANLCTPGFAVRFETDGREPGPSSPFYRKPVPASFAKLAAFTTTGRRGRVIVVGCKGPCVADWANP